MGDTSETTEVDQLLCCCPAGQLLGLILGLIDTRDTGNVKNNCDYAQLANCWG